MMKRALILTHIYSSAFLLFTLSNSSSRGLKFCCAFHHQKVSLFSCFPLHLSKIMSPPSSSTNDRPRRSSTRTLLLAAVTPSPTKNKRQSRSSTGSPLSVLSSSGKKRKRNPLPNRRVLSMEEVDEGKSPLITPSALISKPKPPPSKIENVATVITNNNGNVLLTSELLDTINSEQPFIDLMIPPEELRPSATLTTGQCFHWKAVQRENIRKQPQHQQEEGEGEQASFPSSSSIPSAWGTHDAQEWIGTVRLSPPHNAQSVVLVVRETPNTTLYRPLSNVDNMDALHDFLRHHYFQINRRKDSDHDDNEDERNLTLKELYAEWSDACPRMKVIAKCLPGVRVLQQDPWECLVSFICSSNNNIPRITQMVDSLRKEYGDLLLTIEQPLSMDSKTSSSSSSTTAALNFYSFPSLQDMRSAGVTEDQLRTKCGMGYRAKYILGTMQLLHDKGGESYLHNLLNVDSNDDDGDTTTRDTSLVVCHRSSSLQKKLCEFPGVGRKVADCVALFSLRGDSCIPVDTHVWNIARRDYATTKNEGAKDRDDDDDSKTVLFSTVKSITPSVYDAVGSLFRQRFPNKPGWAHSLLFVAELPSFRPVLPLNLIEQMEEFRHEEQARKKGQQIQKRRPETASGKKKKKAKTKSETKK